MGLINELVERAITGVVYRYLPPIPRTPFSPALVSRDPFFLRLSRSPGEAATLVAGEGRVGVCLERQRGLKPFFMGRGLRRLERHGLGEGAKGGLRIFECISCVCSKSSVMNNK